MWSKKVGFRYLLCTFGFSFSGLSTAMGVTEPQSVTIPWCPCGLVISAFRASVSPCKGHKSAYAAGGETESELAGFRVIIRG